MPLADRLNSDLNAFDFVHIDYCLRDILRPGHHNRQKKQQIKHTGLIVLYSIGFDIYFWSIHGGALHRYIYHHRSLTVSEPLSPILYMLFMAPLYNRRVNPRGYADDGVN
jgi:hypothetical protein